MSDIVPRGARVLMQASVLTALGTRSALNTQSFLDRIAQRLTTKAYTAIVMNGDWLGSNISCEATLTHDKISLDGLLTDFRAAVIEAGGYDAGNLRVVNVTLPSPTGGPPQNFQVTPAQPVGWPFANSDGGDNNPQGDFPVGLAMAGVLLILAVGFLRR